MGQLWQVEAAQLVLTLCCTWIGNWLEPSLCIQVTSHTCFPTPQEQPQVLLLLLPLLKVLAGCASGSCVLVDISSGTKLASWTAHSGAVHSVAWISSSTQQQHQQSRAATVQEISHGTLAGGSGSSEEQSEGAVQQVCHYVLSAGADMSVKLWRVDQLQAAAHQQLSTQAAAAAYTAAGDGTPAAATAEEGATGKAGNGAEDGGEHTLSSSTAAEAALATVERFSVQLVAAAAVRQPPSAGQQQGKHTTMYHAAMAVVPGITGVTGGTVPEGSCLVLLAGAAGSVLLAHLTPGE